MYKKTFGQKMKEVRSVRGLTLEELSDKVGVTKVTLSRYENDIRFPDVNVVTRIARTLGVSVGYLLGEHDDDRIVYVNSMDESREVMDYIYKVLADNGHITQEEAKYGIRDEEKRKKVFEKIRRTLEFIKEMNE